MEEKALPRNELLKMVFTRVALFFPVMALFFFLPAGTFAYWQAWIYLAILFIPMVFVLNYLLKNNPKLLERRMRMREKEQAQKKIVKFSSFFLLLAYIVPGFDFRWGWSHVPLALVVTSFILVLFGYYLVFLVFRENTYTSRIIEVEQGQKVTSSGPYAIVRHPMYIGAILMYLFSPLALGSWWAFIPGAMIIPTIVFRILNEEKILQRDLPGYIEYMQKVKYRLLPGIW